MKKLSVILIVALFLFTKVSSGQSFDFSLEDLDGNTVTLTSLLEKGPVMISFWALWCIPCKEEMKIMSEIYNKYKDSGFVYVAMNQDTPKSSAKVKSYIESKEYKFIVLLDSDAHVFENFGGQNLPYSVLMNKKGDVVKTYTGYVPGDESKIENDLVELIKESK
jgi:cytochrome c biogenesis protein CcmG, thiol:disulfide interchange protein DsbE